jgi:hypothetical protein
MDERRRMGSPGTGGWFKGLGIAKMALRRELRSGGRVVTEWSSERLELSQSY